MTLSDVYEDKKLEEGKKSYTLAFVLTNDSKTLSEKEINNSMHKIQSKIESEFNATLRSSMSNYLLFEEILPNQN